MAMFRPGGLALTRDLIRLGGLEPPARILDVGCGNGESVLQLREWGFDALGIDHDPSRVSKRPGLMVAEAEKLPFKDGSFDAVLSECVLSVTYTRAVLMEMARVLKPGGRLLMSDLYSYNDPPPPTLDLWEELLEDHGFTVLRVRDQTHELRAFAARLIWEGASFDDCLDKRFDEMGYCLIIAERSGENG